MEMRGAFGSLR
jgi:carbonic anhydrase